MSPDTPGQSRPAAIEQLEALGLSTYAARTFVGLVELEAGTAQDVSEVVNVPRTRVYDAVEELGANGLVDIQESTPKRFWAVSAETAGRNFEQEYTDRVERLTDALDALEATDHSSKQRGVWTVTGRETVTDRVVEFVESAEDEVAFMTVEALLDEVVVESLEAATERGVTVRLAEMSPSATEQLRGEVPDAEPFDSLWDWSDTPAGRLLMVDGERTLVSVLASSDDPHLAEPRTETAIWGSGQANGLVVVLKTMFTWQLDGNRG